MAPAGIRSQAGQWQCTVPARAAVPAGKRGPPPCRYRRWSRSTWRGCGGCFRCCCRWPGPGPRAAATRRTAAGWWARCRRKSGARWSGPTPPSPTPSSCSGVPCPLHPGEAAGGFRGPPGAAQHGQHLLLPQSSALPAVDVPFREYVEQLLKPQDLAQLGSDTLYFFGDNNFTEWGPLFQQYVPPAFRIPGTSPAYSFGIAGSGSGVPFHWHGPGYSEVIFGRKRWFLYPPDKTPHFHPNETTLAWLYHTYPALPLAERPLECTLRPGEVLYFPDRWWHATLNLDTSVFISTFLG
ncbi:jmjC domain-containing protein 8 isoform X1 [Columba livia]|uniref:jmjC domain-containing protein 8 isoform X1 n=1 Tax=Columba livia TaxID=8932 RepID=UPI0031BA1AFC